MSNDKVFVWTDELVNEYKNKFYHWEQQVKLSPIEQFKASKQSISKDYEILSYGVGNPIPILKVKRLSDNSVWSVGDDTTQGKIAEITYEPENGLFIHVYTKLLSYNYPFRINEISKPKQVLFTTDAERPPIGIIPEWLWKEQRCGELIRAIDRYGDACKDIPNEWVNEALKLASEILAYKQKIKQ